MTRIPAMAAVVSTTLCTTGLPSLINATRPVPREPLLILRLRFVPNVLLETFLVDNKLVLMHQAAPHQSSALLIVLHAH